MVCSWTRFSDTGMKNDVRGLYAEAITLMNACEVCRSSRSISLRVSIPITGTPLGVSDSGGDDSRLGYPKLGEVIYPGLNYVGELAVADIGIDARAVKEVSP